MPQTALKPVEAKSQKTQTTEIPGSNNDASLLRPSTPVIIKLHKFSGRPFKRGEAERFIEGPMATAHKAILSLPKETIVEDELD
jgi:hypothetical protein